MTILVIMGAGASYDSDRTTPPRRPDVIFSDPEPFDRPPLAAQLFERHRPGSPYALAIDRYPRAVPLIDRVRDATASGASVEELLGEFQEERVWYPEMNAQLAATRYYLRDLIASVEHSWFERCNHFLNHTTLFDRLSRYYSQRNESTVIVTFNYDTLIERALGDVLRLKFETLEDYVQDSRMRLYKPHGSFNWARFANLSPDLYEYLRPIGIAPAAEVIELSREIAATDLFGVVEPREQSVSSDPVGVWLPAIAIPTNGKQFFEAPEAHMADLKASLADVTRTLVVGWRGAEEHFLRLLMHHLPVNNSVCVVAESDEAAQVTTDALWRTRKFSRYQHVGSGFSGFVSHDDDLGGTALELFLKDRGWINRAPGAGVEPLEWESAD